MLNTELVDFREYGFNKIILMKLRVFITQTWILEKMGEDRSIQSFLEGDFSYKVFLQYKKITIWYEIIIQFYF